MPIAFQPNAFQGGYPGPSAFQTFDRIVSVGNGQFLGFVVREFLSIEIGPLMQEYALTTAIVLEARIFDPSSHPAMPFDPDSVVLDLYNPDGTLELNDQALSLISTGFYRYTWQSQSNDQLGVYQGNIKAVSGSNTAQTITQALFRLVTII